MKTAIWQLVLSTVYLCWLLLTYVYDNYKLMRNLIHLMRNLQWLEYWQLSGLMHICYFESLFIWIICGAHNFPQQSQGLLSNATNFFHFFLRKWFSRFLLELHILWNYEFYSQEKQKYLFSSSTGYFIFLHISLKQHLWPFYCCDSQWRMLSPSERFNWLLGLLKGHR